jgi:histidine ammonia-lyase
MGKGTAAAYALLRLRVPFLEADAVMAPRMEQVCRLVAEGHILRAPREGIGMRVERIRPWRAFGQQSAWAN